MLNKDLLDDKEITIYALKSTIKAFKSYDKQRKEYVKQLEHDFQDYKYKYEDIQSLMTEENILNVDKTYEKIQELRQQIKDMNNTISEKQKVLKALNSNIDLAVIKNIIQAKSEEEVDKYAENLHVNFIAERKKYQHLYERLKKDYDKLMLKQLKCK